MSFSVEPPLPPSYPRHEHETLIQYNLRNKVCAYCKRPGAHLKCEGCRQRSYCDRTCQKKDWKQEHRGQCVKLQQVFVPPPPGWRDAAAVEAVGGGGGAGAAATIVEDLSLEDETVMIVNQCPVCLDNEDDATVAGSFAAGCCACGQFYCGACNRDGFVDRSPNCPTCRAPLVVPEEESFTRCWKLVHGRSPGRHTPLAQNDLGSMYRNGEGVAQDYVEAAKWFRKSAEAGVAAAQYNLGLTYSQSNGVEQDHGEAAKWFRKAAQAGDAMAQYKLGLVYDTGKGVEQDHVAAVKWYRVAAEAGDATAQCNLGCMYDDGKGVEQDHVEAAKWFRKSAEAGNADAQYNLGFVYGKGYGVEPNYAEALKWLQMAALQGIKIALPKALGCLDLIDLLQMLHVIPTPPPGTTVTTILLTSASACKYNDRTGRVVEPTEGAAIKPGRAAVLLDGDADPISFKLKNLQLT